MKRTIALTTSLTEDLIGKNREDSGVYTNLKRAFYAIQSLVYSLLGFTLLTIFWYLISRITEGGLPAPAATFNVLWELVKDPFYDYGPNDKGIGLQLGSSLGRVFLGFFLGSLVAIPIGLLMGANAFCPRE